jgi:hypothetical protein
MGMLLTNISGATPTAILASVVNGQSGVSAIQGKDKLDIWIDRLALKESEGNAHIKILDHNNQYSYGCLQFQMATFESYVHKYNLLPEAEDKELLNMIYDCDFQKTLAKTMIEDDYSNWRNWYISSKSKIGLPPKPEELALAGVSGVN